MKRYLTATALFSAIALGATGYAARSVLSATELKGDIGKDLGQMSQISQITIFNHCAGQHGSVPKLLRACREDSVQQENALTAAADQNFLKGALSTGIATLALIATGASVSRMRRETARRVPGPYTRMHLGQ